MATWKRPENLPYPLTYVEFEKTGKDGKSRKYWIQDLTEEYYEDVVDHYVNGFMKDEPLCTYTKACDDPLSKKEFGEFWMKMLNDKISLICLTKGDDGEIKIAGFNCLYICTPEEKDIKLESPASQKVIGIVKHLSSIKDPFKEFEITEYLSAMGLYVTHDFRGLGIGQVIIGAREQLCAKLGIKASLTLFTSFISQKQAARAGFKDYVTVPYQEMPEHLIIPRIHEHTKICKFMVRVY